MTTDNALMNRKTRIRSGITTADVSDPTTSSNFIETKGCSYVEITVNGLSGIQECTIRTFFYETVNNSGSKLNYVSRGAALALSLEKGNTCNIPGVNGRPVYIKLEALTSGATVNIDLAPGRVPPGLNV
ncbi:MAG: hypothetical protein AB1782_09085 [Cyanobacteriota bacterium]